MRQAIGWLLALAATAAAQPRNEDKAEADRLFEEARALLADNKREEACAKFELSFRKDPRAVGTMLNLGLCGEMSGKVATAIRYYEEARDRGRDQQLPEYVAAAERKIALLSPRVPRVTIRLAEQLPGTRVLVDTTVLAPDQLAALPVDPGAHTVVVTAPDRLPYETTVELAEGAQQTVPIPALEGQKTVTVVVQASKRRTWGKVGVLAGGGLVLAAAGLGYYAQHAYWSQFPAGAREDRVVLPDGIHPCWTAEVGADVVRQCNSIGEDKLRSARRTGWIATGVGVTGLVVLAAGAYAWLSAPSDRAVPATTIGVTASRELTGVTLGGTF
ncbi:MAG TPA: hypothetical protein VM513_15580 [Kofleriaceae bacterium]|nr:hypothetical protein [Kofleriaceae bacterium]